MGLKINPNAETSRDYYINAAFCYNQDLLLMAGLNHEIRFNHSKSFYTHLVTGVDYYKMDPLFYDLGGSDSEDKDKKSGLSPHISGGLGFRSAIGKDVHLYIELDVGIKASIANINIGIMM
ncbi:MAG TPA: hypothetical protein P5342_07325 [Candidatus Cloacimonadota bacterium]|nr:hypothetical protein [Candidatus Cloacimonadota bacterium]